MAAVTLSPRRPEAAAESPVVYLGIAVWLAAYALMLHVTVEHGVATWPLMPWAAYSLVWEWLDALNLLGGQTPRKRLLHLAYALLDTALLYDQFMARPGAALVLFVALGSIAVRYPRDFKYFHYIWHFGEHLAEASLPAYREHRLLQLAIWLQVLGNFCYIPKSQNAPKQWRTLYWWVARAMPVWCACVNMAVIHYG